MTTPLTLEQVPFPINIRGVVRDDLVFYVDLDIDITGYTWSAYVDTNAGTSVAITVAVTNAALGQLTCSLTDAQMASIGVGDHNWYIAWTVSGFTRTAYAGKFTVTKYG